MVPVGKPIAEVGCPLDTNGSEALAGASVKYAVLVSRPSGANPFSNSRRIFGSSVSLVWHGSIMAASSSPVDALATWTPCRPKPQNKRQLDEGENGDRHGRPRVIVFSYAFVSPRSYRRQSRAHLRKMQANRRQPGLKATILLLQIDGLIVAAPVELRAPYFVHSLMLGPTVVNRRAKSQIQVPQPLQCVHQVLGVELRPSAP
jgi:hypothetical protein